MYRRSLGMDGDRKPGPLGLPRRSLSRAEQQAQEAELDLWVAQLQAWFEDYWPPAPKGPREFQRVRDLPWPRCWRQHHGLVADLIALKAWSDALLQVGGDEAAAKSWMEWTSTVQHLLAPRIQRLARLCQHRHRGPVLPVEPSLTDLARKQILAARQAMPRQVLPSERRIVQKPPQNEGLT